MSAEERIKELGLDLHGSPARVGNHVPAVRTGNLIFITGQLPTYPDGSRPTGKLGLNMSVEEGYKTARLTATAVLAHLRNAAGSLDRVTRIVKVTGFVNATPEFSQQAQVVNGASDLLVEVFGDAGKHARSSMGANSLQDGVPVEIDLVAEVE